MTWLNDFHDGLTFFFALGEEKKKGENIILSEEERAECEEDAICMIITAEPPLVEIW